MTWYWPPNNALLIATRFVAYSMACRTIGFAVALDAFMPKAMKSVQVAGGKIILRPSDFAWMMMFGSRLLFAMTACACPDCRESSALDSSPTWVKVIVCANPWCLAFQNDADFVSVIVAPIALPVSPVT